MILEPLLHMHILINWKSGLRNTSDPYELDIFSQTTSARKASWNTGTVRPESTLI